MTSFFRIKGAFFSFFSKMIRRICVNFFLRLRRKHLFITTCIEKQCTRPLSINMPKHSLLIWKTNGKSQVMEICPRSSSLRKLRVSDFLRFCWKRTRKKFCSTLIFQRTFMSAADFANVSCTYIFAYNLNIRSNLSNKYYGFILFFHPKFWKTFYKRCNVFIHLFIL